MRFVRFILLSFAIGFGPIAACGSDSFSSDGGEDAPNADTSVPPGDGSGKDTGIDARDSDPPKDTGLDLGLGIDTGKDAGKDGGSTSSDGGSGSTDGGVINLDASKDG